MQPTDNPTIRIRTMRRKELLAQYKLTDVTFNRRLKRDNRAETVKLRNEIKGLQVFFPDQVRRLVAILGPWETDYTEP
ncbi:hypothetical protein [Fibrella forsythiae]|uniref:50S ribosomal protein L29 n=1 Tax=Fibrella forsythiae TaxID=2817061 RepID=A0ABS3JNH7_9BACT|nr:hypothetical protein [Fibrella forsythiae]MBO0951579.1 hypothetical protein [Fibrella forsythiae]